MGETPVTEGKISRVFRGIRHVHQNRDLFRFSLVVEKLSLRVPTAKRLVVEWTRGPKRIKSNEVRTLHRGVWECRWEIPLVLEATLFYSDQRNSDARCYHSKLSKIKFVNPVKSSELFGELYVDLGKLTSGALSLMLPVQKSSDPQSWAKLLIKCERINGAPSDPSEGSLYSKTPIRTPSPVSGGCVHKSRNHGARLPPVGGDCPLSVGASWTRSPRDAILSEGIENECAEKSEKCSAEMSRKRSEDNDTDRSSSSSTLFVDETSAKGNIAIERDGYHDTREWTDDYVRVPKEELIAKLQRLKSALKHDQPRELVLMLEEELIDTKVKLAQAESEKDELMEAARLTISELSATVENNAKVLTELEHQLTLLKLSSHGRKRISSVPGIKLKKLLKPASKSEGKRKKDGKISI